MVKYLNAPGKWKDPDRYVYVPALRRVRRSRGGDRQDDALGYPVTNDDNGERQMWEEGHELIGEDVICEINGMRGYGLLGPPEVIVEHPMNPGAWGEGLNPYREDRCVEAWVIKSTHRDRKYYLGHRLVWVEKYTKTPIRQEHYDKEGKYSPGELLREYFWQEPPNYRSVVNQRQYPPPPLLYEDKQSKRRNLYDAIGQKTFDSVKERQEMWRKRGGFDPWGWAKRTKHQDVQ